MFEYFDYEYLYRQAETGRKKYLEAEPFPHFVLDYAADHHKLGNLLSHFPKQGDLKWWSYDNALEKKLAFDRVAELDRPFREVLTEMNSHPFVRFLEELTGINGLICDNTFRGGGLHQIMPGGKLDIHADYNFHKGLRLRRRLNVIMYLNKHWQEEFGGHLELWSRDMFRCVQKILPVFNRMVVFETSDDTYHGHPDPLNCPDGISRKSMALYYFTSDMEPKDTHSTVFKKRPQDPDDMTIETMRVYRAKGGRL